MNEYCGRALQSLPVLHGSKLNKLDDVSLFQLVPIVREIHRKTTSHDILASVAETEVGHVSGV